MKLFVPLLLAFVSGFLLHMFVFSDVLPQTFIPARPSSTTTKKTEPTPEFAQSMVYTEYKNRAFNPKTIVSKRGNHIKIRNVDATEKMWLVSDAPFLSTPRAYGESEEIDVVPTEAGTFMVRNKLHEGPTLTVIVKP